MSRLAKKVQQEQTRQARLRPYVLGFSVSLALVATILVAGFWESEPEVPPISVTAGRIQVGGEDASGAGRHAIPPAPVRFYELLAKGEQSAEPPTEELVVRDLPLPPPAGEAAPPVAVVSVPLPAVEVAPDVSADIPDGINSGVKTDENASPQTVVSANTVVTLPVSAKKTPVITPQAQKPPKQPAVAPLKTQQSATPKRVKDAVPSTPPKAAPSVTVALPYTLQVGSFSRQDRADELISRLARKGHDAYAMEVDLGAKGVWWRVRVGHYPTAQDARWAKLELVRLGVSPMVVRDHARPAP